MGFDPGVSFISGRGFLKVKRVDSPKDGFRKLAKIDAAGLQPLFGSKKTGEKWKNGKMENGNRDAVVFRTPVIRFCFFSNPTSQNTSKRTHHSAPVLKIQR